MDAGLSITIAAIVWSIALLAQVLSRRASTEFAYLTARQADPSSTVLPPNALELRLAPELRWAEATGRPVGIAVFRLRGANPDAAAAALRDHMRGGEAAYQLRIDEFAIAFWDTGAVASRSAVARLGAVLEAPIAQVVEVGAATFPEDGATHDELLACARERRSVLEFARGARPEPPSGRPYLRPLLASLPGVVGAMIIATLMWRAADWWGGWEAERTAGAATIVALLLGSVTALATGVVAAHTSRVVPRRFPLADRAQRTATWMIAAVATVTGIAFALALALTSVAAMCVATLSVLVLCLYCARPLVHSTWWVLALLAAVGACLLVATRTAEGADLANAGRIVLAVAVGCAVARTLERWSWSVWIMAGASVLDVWSVLSEHGTTRELATIGSTAVASSLRAVSDPLTLDDLLYSGPPLRGAASFQLGISDLLLMAMCIATAHVWRLGERAVTLAMLAGASAALAMSQLRGDLVPAIPCLALAYVVTIGTVRRTSAYSD